MYEDNSVNPVLGAAATISIDRYRPIGIIGKKKFLVHFISNTYFHVHVCQGFIVGSYQWSSGDERK